MDTSVVKKVLKSWGPGKYDAELNLDGKAFRPDGKSAATLIPAAYGLAGVNLHTYTGWGAVPYWNAYVGILQMHGQGNFFDPRLNDQNKFPLAAKNNLDNTRTDNDLITSKLPALHYYQLSLASPKPPEGSYNVSAAQSGETIFNTKAKCITCHVPPLFTEPGWAIHKGDEIGIDDFQAMRSPADWSLLRSMMHLEKKSKHLSVKYSRLEIIKSASMPLPCRAEYICIKFRQGISASRRRWFC